MSEVVADVWTRVLLVVLAVCLLSGGLLLMYIEPDPGVVPGAAQQKPADPEDEPGAEKHEEPADTSHQDPDQAPSDD